MTAEDRRLRDLIAQWREHAEHAEREGGGQWGDGLALGLREAADELEALLSPEGTTPDEETADTDGSLRDRLLAHAAEILKWRGDDSQGAGDALPLACDAEPLLWEAAKALKGVSVTKEDAPVAKEIIRDVANA